MKKIITAFLTVLLSSSIAYCAVQNVKRLDGSRISIDELEAKIQKLMEQGRVPGLAIAILNDNKIVYLRAFGYRNAQTKEPLDNDSIFDAASLSKAIFSYYVMHLVETGRIDLDKPLVAYLHQPLYEYKFENKRRGYADLENDERYKKITARMCLDHSTGFPNWRWFEDDEKLKIKFFPGTDYSYSGEGIYLLQFVIEQRLNEKFEDAVRRDVLGPLGMSRSSFIWQPEFESNVCFGHDETEKASALTEWKESSAAGSLFTTISDFSHFFEAVMQRRGLKKKSFEEMFKPQFRIFSKKQFGPLSKERTNENDGINLSYGLGWGLLKSKYGWAFFKEGHDDGFQHYSIGIPEKGIGVVIMTDSDNGESIFKELLDVAIKDDFTPWFWEGYL